MISMTNISSLKGHAAPVLYAAWAEAGVIPIDELKNLRKIDSELEGHPTPVTSSNDYHHYLYYIFVAPKLH